MVLKAAIVGCGRIGCSFDDDPLRKTISTHAKAYNTTPKTRLFALCDIDKEKLAKYGKKYSVEYLFTNIDDMLEEVKPDLLSICTLPDQHEKITVKAAKAGVKGIFCEKPIASNSAEARHMINVCKENGTVLLVDHQRRFDPLYSVIRENIKQGLLGKIHHSTFYYTAGIYNTGTHSIDLMRYFFGNIEWVIGKYSVAGSYNKHDPNVDGLLKFNSGVLATIQALNDNDYLIFEQDILGSAGRLRILSSGTEVEYFDVSDSKYFSGYKELDRKNVPFEIPVKREPMLEGINHLVDCVENRVNPLSSGQDGSLALEGILALVKSAEDESKKVYLPQQ